MRSAERFWLHAWLQRGLLSKSVDADGNKAVKGPFTAKVVLSEIRVNQSTLTGRVRVNVEELGIPADLEWDAREEPPQPGDGFKVEPVSVIMAGIRSGLVVRRV